MIIDKKNREEQYKDRKYEVVSYNVEWPQQFETYALQIRNIFGDVQIDHIGSTSVPGMSGKDCIDVLVVVKDLRVVEQHIEDMKKMVLNMQVNSLWKVRGCLGLLRVIDY